MERRSSQEYSVVFLVEGKNFKLRNLPTRTSSLLSVPLRTRWAQRLSSQYFSAVPTPNIAELVPSGFFCLQPWFLQQSEQIFPEKNPPVLSTELRSINSCLSNDNEIKLIHSGRLVDWLERCPSIQAAGLRIHEGEKVFSFHSVSFLFFLSFCNYFKK